MKPRLDLWTGMAAVALVWVLQPGISGGDAISGRIWLGIILVLLLVAGIFLVVRGLRDLIRDVRRSSVKTEHRQERPATQEDKRKAA